MATTTTRMFSATTLLLLLFSIPSNAQLPPATSPVNTLTVPSPSDSTTATPAPSPGGLDCMATLLNISDCLDYIATGSINLPRPDNKYCCPELAGLVESSPVCLCELLGNPGAIGFDIDVKRATKMLQVCKVSTPPVGLCDLTNKAKTAVPSPSDSTTTTAPSPGGLECMPALLNISDCLPYIMTGSNLTKPDKPCCPELAGMVESSPVCLCELVGNPGASGFDIDAKRVIKLLPVCKVSTPPVSLCDLRNKAKTAGKSKTTAIVVCIIVALIILSLSLWYLVVRRRRRRKRQTEVISQQQLSGNQSSENEEVLVLDAIGGSETKQYDFALIRAATHDFSTANMLGRGGFGVVYKGVLSNGKEVAVKRLSATSGQGEKEFRNEVMLLAKLQHNCLVKLLGSSLQKTERLLVYEFMANGSLDKILFDPVNQSRLDWDIRCKIIKSVAKGILYLHEDSRLKIIHRDLKASNILLDEELNAKISDFGMAKLFVWDESQANTKRIAGTFGYMAPEYVMHGLFSVKSDVYSYGVLILEIVCGKRNYYSQAEDRVEDLLSYAYKIWKEGRASDLIDPMLMAYSDSLGNMIRCIHIALLCVQENVGNRPTMAIVVQSLQSLTLTLPLPTEPGFFGNTALHRPWISDFQQIPSSAAPQDEDIDSYLYPR